MEISACDVGNFEDVIAMGVRNGDNGDDFQSSCLLFLG